MAKTLAIIIFMLFPILVLSQEGKQNTSTTIEQIINEQGIEEAQKKFDEILARTGSTDEANENFEKSLELNPANENAVKNLSQIYGTRSDGKYIFYTKNRDIYWVSTNILKHTH